MVKWIALYLAIGSIFASGFMHRWEHKCEGEEFRIRTFFVIAVIWPLAGVAYSYPIPKEGEEDSLPICGFKFHE